MVCLYVATVLEVSYLQPRHLPYQMVRLDLLLLPLNSGYQLGKLRISVLFNYMQLWNNAAIIFTSISCRLVKFLSWSLLGVRLGVSSSLVPVVSFCEAYCLLVCPDTVRRLLDDLSWVSTGKYEHGNSRL